MRLELEAKRLNAENRGITQGRIMPARVKSPDLPSFIDGKDDLNSYLLRFERYATITKWEEEIWATQLSALLSGKALDFYSKLSQEDALDYKKLKRALLNRYNFTEHGYRQHFHAAKPEGQESPSQFVIRLKNYFAKWVQLSEVEVTFEGVSDLMVRKQFSSSCSKELAVYLTERNPKDLEELSDLAEQYLIAQGKGSLLQQAMT